MFGTVFDKKRYEKTVFACALKEDIEKFPEGDSTIIGERGSNLSGGQKQRVSLGIIDTQLCEFLKSNFLSNLNNVDTDFSPGNIFLQRVRYLLAG